MLIGVLKELSDKHTAMEARLLAQNVRFKIAPFGLLRSEGDTARILGYRDADYAKYVAALKKANPNAKPQPKEEWRKIAPFGLSYHNYGGAFDVEITSVDGVEVYRTPTPAALWKSNPNRAATLYEKGMAAARHTGIAVGLARIHDDDPHFQLPYSLVEVKKMSGYKVTALPNLPTPTPVSAVGILAIIALALLAVRKWMG